VTTFEPQTDASVLHAPGRLLGPIATRVGCTEGQLCTVVTGVALAAALVLSSAHGTAATAAAPGPTVPAPVGAAQPTVVVPSPPSEAPPIAPPAIGPFAAIPQPTAGPTAPVTSSTSFGSQPSVLTPGQVATIASLVGPSEIAGIAAAPDGAIWVTTRVNPSAPQLSRLIGLSNTGVVTRSIVMLGQTVTRPHSFAGVVVSSDGSVVVVDTDGARLVKVDPTAGTQTVLATIPNVPVCVPGLVTSRCEQGVVDHAPQLASVVATPSGSLLISDPGQDTIWRWRAGSGLSVFHQSSYDVEGDGPAGLAYADGLLRFTVGATLDPAAPGGGALYRVPVADDGTPGTVTLQAAFARGARPGSITVGASGVSYILLRGTGAIVTVDPQGTTQPLAHNTSGGTPPLDGVRDLALAPGRLLVANQPPPSSNRRPQVLAIGVSDAPSTTEVR
jgi:hypothetical protein